MRIIDQDLEFCGCKYKKEMIIYLFNPKIHALEMKLRGGFMAVVGADNW